MRMRVRMRVMARMRGEDEDVGEGVGEGEGIAPQPINSKSPMSQYERANDELNSGAEAPRIR